MTATHDIEIREICNHLKKIFFSRIQYARERGDHRGINGLFTSLFWDTFDSTERISVKVPPDVDNLPNRWWQGDELGLC